MIDGLLLNNQRLRTVGESIQTGTSVTKKKPQNSHFLTFVNVQVRRCCSFHVLRKSKQFKLLWIYSEDSERMFGLFYFLSKLCLCKNHINQQLCVSCVHLLPVETGAFCVGQVTVFVFVFVFVFLLLLLTSAGERSRRRRSHGQRNSCVFKIKPIIVH